MVWWPACVLRHCLHTEQFEAEEAEKSQACNNYTDFTSIYRICCLQSFRKCVKEVTYIALAMNLDVVQLVFAVSSR